MDSLLSLQQRYFQALMDGNRRQCRTLLMDALRNQIPADELLLDVIWNCMEQISRLFREDRINFVTEHLATRINRALADQLQPHLRTEPSNGKRLIVCCSDVEGYELGAQIVADLFEADGWDVWFVGSSVPMDELAQLIGTVRPELLLYFGTEPGGIPEVRRAVQMLHRIDASPHTAVLAAGGVFNRAPGLWIEVGADAFAPDARSALAQAGRGIEIRKHTVAVQGQPKRRRRKGSLLTAGPTG